MYLISSKVRPNYIYNHCVTYCKLLKFANTFLINHIYGAVLSARNCSFQEIVNKNLSLLFKE
jgi:hypothetical protein